MLREWLLLFSFAATNLRHVSVYVVRQPIRFKPCLHDAGRIWKRNKIMPVRKYEQKSVAFTRCRENLLPDWHVTVFIQWNRDNFQYCWPCSIFRLRCVVVEIWRRVRIRSEAFCAFPSTWNLFLADFTNCFGVISLTDRTIIPNTGLWIRHFSRRTCRYQFCKL